MTEISEKELSGYSRSDLIFLARIYDKAEKHKDMVKCINYFVKMNPKLNIEERNLLSAGYKNVISGKRFSWRYLQNQIKKEEKEGNTLAVSYVNEIKLKVENEIKEVCKEIHSLLDSHLLPAADDIEYKIYFLKMRGDYFRYPCEFLKDEEFAICLSSAEKSYKEAYELAEKFLPISSITRLGTALNYSVLLFEIKDQREEATLIAKASLDEGLKVLDELEKNKQKDTILIIQLLMENLMLWNAEDTNDDQ
jgi:14-3-3 protein epsilon